MYSQPIHLSHELILLFHIKLERVTEIRLQKVHAGAAFWTSELPTQIFFDLQPHLILEVFVLTDIIGTCYQLDDYYKI